MKLKILILAAILAVSNCATYKQLQPKPELVGEESGYIELKKGKKNFSVKKGKKYFIAFPAPRNDYSYLIIASPQKSKFKSALTAEFEKRKQPGALITEESWAPDTMSVYPVDRNKPAYYWLIEETPEKLEDLLLTYRYSPQWRFKFEHKHASYKETMAKNRVDRGVYNSIGTSLHLEGYNYGLVIDRVSRHTSALKEVQKELLDLESIFPSTIVNSTDVAYLNYKKLRAELDEEVEFQTNFVNVLGFFHREYQTRGNAFAFLGFTEDFITYFSMEKKFPEHIVSESRTYLKKRFNEVPAFYDKRLAEKNDATPFDTNFFRIGALKRFHELYSAAGITMTPEMSLVTKFMNDFDAKSIALVGLKDSCAKIEKHIKDSPPMPSDDFFKGVNARAGRLQALVPTAIDEACGKYRSIECSNKLNEEIGVFNTALLKTVAQYREAEAIVQQLNLLKPQREYSAMLGILKQRSQLGFLIDKYRELDKLSIDEQVKTISGALASNVWAQAEGSLRTLHADENFIDPSMLSVKAAAVRDYEDTLYSKVERVTRSAVNKFCEDNATTYENIDSLYADSVFLPVHDITFSSGSRRDLVERKNALIADLAKLKENEFPAKSIKLLYDQFLKTPDDNGVLKARAIVAHGKHYTGEDKDVKIRIAEADPLSAKWIVKPKEYRRVFVVPVTDNPRGKNKYIVRFNVKIPTEAVFPVYDVNIKLPKEVAQNAASTQWYDQITCNRGVLKNEGRFTIGAPAAANNYECQITPVQMNKDKTNVLEIVFHHNAFKVLQVSVMVQKPIIKKN